MLCQLRRTLRDELASSARLEDRAAPAATLAETPPVETANALAASWCSYKQSSRKREGSNSSSCYRYCREFLYGVVRSSCVFLSFFLSFVCLFSDTHSSFFVPTDLCLDEPILNSASQSKPMKHLLPPLTKYNTVILQNTPVNSCSFLSFIFLSRTICLTWCERTGPVVG